MGNNLKYTCKDYREEMILLSLRQQLNQNRLTKEERKEIRRRIEELETGMAMS